MVDAPSAKIERTEQKKSSTIIISQLPVEKWNEMIGEKTIADTILDRLVYSSHRMELRGESFERERSKLMKYKKDKFNAEEVNKEGGSLSSGRIGSHYYGKGGSSKCGICIC